jgi:hypothetical protein
MSKGLERISSKIKVYSKLKISINDTSISRQINSYKNDNEIQKKCNGGKNKKTFKSFRN